MKKQSLRDRKLEYGLPYEIMDLEKEIELMKKELLKNIIKLEKLKYKYDKRYLDK